MINEKKLKRIFLDYSCNIKMYESQLKKSKSMYDSMKKAGTLFRGENNIDMISFEAGISSIMKNISDAQNEITRYIDAIEQPYKGIIYEKYVLLKSFDEIASTFSYSVQRIYQLHKKGLELLLRHINTL